MEREPGAESALAEALAALGNPARLDLLRVLRTPKTLREIELRIAGEGQDRAASRQNVRKHLDRLVEQGLVVTRAAERAYGRTTEYLVNNQRLYGFAEEFRLLARLRPADEPEARTVVGDAPTAAVAPGPALVLIKGVDEGATFQLAPPGPRGGWVIGRRRDADVALDFDPYVSADNSLVEWDADGFWIRALPTSRNGTRVNFAALDPDARRPLRHGDVIHVGRSVLLFRS